MTYDLFIGDRTFSSWSLRGWLMLENFGLPHRSHMIGLYSGTMAADLTPLAPARLVPVLRCPDGTIVGDTLAMAETLGERHPELGLWPADPAARALARWLVAEMHSGFTALRDACPMQLLGQYQGFAASDAVRADLARIEDLWALARQRHGTGGRWLFGRYSLADVFFAPVAARIAGFDLPVSAAAGAYVATALADPAFRRWRALGLTVSYAPEPYRLDLPRGDWPGPAPLAARALPHGPSENAACPYSGKPVTDFLELDGRVFGFCNPTCRDKTVNDPAAWPAFMALLG
ncbi:glutathione S-transferase N-terminal domain-containing protein [Pseudooceanicola sp.]|uniref:glutathione S-transferase N-terminal domain-containing protein n=1 Tax=Pseudooceanicola sp. TaxID=1914328 RepID=UPI00260BFE4F|nr:glutathione S-transferase N-terminal domain-containing protein [Pseudooceanicola sp.]MDF1854628.1 glutathione S-transferase N-terminal domain-containing protein [Pseudooceanicola sp.]